MSYEDQVRFKHEVEDSIMNLIFLSSLLTERELELAIAKLGDVAKKKPDASIDAQQALKAQILNHVRTLRSDSQSIQNKARRLWFTRKKGKIKREVAQHEYILAKSAYEEEVRKLRPKNEESQRLYEKAYRAWQAECKKQALLKRLFAIHPPKPNFPTRYVPNNERPDIFNIERRLSGLDFGNLLIERILIHEFPDVEVAREFATEDGVRTYEQRLLQESR